MSEEPLTHASFFSGAGGTDIGLERAGFRTVSVSEIEPYASALLTQHYPGVPQLGDITKIRPEDIPDAYLWSGGFPCQDLSIAGKRRGFGGERSVLAFAFLDLVERRRPPALLLENVPGLLTSHRGRDLFTLTSRLAELGYGWAFRVLDARHFGVPQRRRRVFIFALRSGPDDPEGRIASQRAAEVLAVGHRCRWHPPAGLATGSSPARAAGGGPGLVGSIPAGVHGWPGSIQEFQQGFYIPEFAGALKQRDSRGPDGEGAADGKIIAVDQTARAIHTSSGRRSGPAGDEVANLVVGALTGKPYDDRGHEQGQLVQIDDGDGASPGASGGRTVGPVRAGGHGDPGIGRDDDWERLVVREAADASGVRAADGLAGRLDDRPELAPTLRIGAASVAAGRPGDTVPLTTFVKRERARSSTSPESWAEGEVAPTLNSFDSGDGRATALVASGSLLAESGIVQSLTGRKGGRVDAADAQAGHLPVVEAGAPEEDDPLLPLGLDSHRYRCCGNGVVAPVAHWLGLQIAADARAHEG